MKFNKIITSIILLIITLFTFMLLVNEKKEFSENENRYLQTESKFTFKRLLEGEFISDFESMLTDQFPFRNTFMSIKLNFDKLLGKQSQNGVYLGKDNYLLQKYDKPENNDKIIKKINEFNMAANIDLNVMIVPTSITINDDKLPKNAPTYDEMETINYIYNNLKIDKKIDLYDSLKETNKKYQMFYYLDHHWTSYGAYVAYTEFAKLNNLTSIKLSKFDIKEVSDRFNGTLYSKTNDYSRKPDLIHTFTYGDNDLKVEYVMSKKIRNSLYEDSYLEKKDKYSYFLDNNHPLIVVTNNSINNSNEIIIIKDSYANSFVPFLVNHYKKIHIIDPRFYKLSISDYIKENNIKTGLFLYNVNTLDSDTGILSIR